MKCILRRHISQSNSYKKTAGYHATNRCCLCSYFNFRSNLVTAKKNRHLFAKYRLSDAPVGCLNVEQCSYGRGDIGHKGWASG